MSFKSIIIGTLLLNLLSIFAFANDDVEVISVRPAQRYQEVPLTFSVPLSGQFDPTQQCASYCQRFEAYSSYPYNFSASSKTCVPSSSSESVNLSVTLDPIFPDPDLDLVEDPSTCQAGCYSHIAYAFQSACAEPIKALQSTGVSSRPLCADLSAQERLVTDCQEDSNPGTEEIAVSSTECNYPSAQHEAYEAQFQEDSLACRQLSSEGSTCCNDPVACMMGGGTVGGTVSGLLQVAPVLATAGANSQANVCKTIKNLTRAGTALNLVASNTCSEKIDTCSNQCENMRLQAEEARALAAQNQAEFEQAEQYLLEMRNQADQEARNASAAGQTALATQKSNEASNFYTASVKCRRNASAAASQLQKYRGFMTQFANNITQCQGLSVKRDELRTASVVQLGFSEVAAKCEDAVGDTTQDSGGEETVAFNNDCTDARNVNHPICIQCRGTSACSNPVCSGIQLAVTCTTTTSTDNQRFGNPLDDQTGFGESPDLSRFEDGGSTLSADPTPVAIQGGNGVNANSGGGGGGGVSAAAGGGSAGLGSTGGGGGYGGSQKPKVTLSERSGGGYSVARGSYGSGGGYSQRGGRGSVGDNENKKGKGVNLNDLLGKKTNRKVAGLSGGLKSPVHPSHVNIFERIHNRYQIKCKSRLLLGCDGKTANQHEQFYKSDPGR